MSRRQQPKAPTNQLSPEDGARYTTLVDEAEAEHAAAVRDGRADAIDADKIERLREADAAAKLAAVRLGALHPFDLPNVVAA